MIHIFVVRTFCVLPHIGITHTDCKKTELGETYTGATSVTVSGAKCKAWADTGDWNYDNKFPHDGSVSAASNFCRNPDDDSGGPWCNKVDGGWEYCDISICTGVYSDFYNNMCMSIHLHWW